MISGHHQHHSQGCACHVPGVALELRDCLECLLLAYHDELPRLIITGTARPASYLEDGVDHLLWNRVGTKLADGAQAAQESYDLLRVFCLYHDKYPLSFPLFVWM